MRMLSPSLVSACEIVSLPVRRAPSRLRCGTGAFGGRVRTPRLARALRSSSSSSSVVLPADKSATLAAADSPARSAMRWRSWSFAFSASLSVFFLPSASWRRALGLVGDFLFLLVDAAQFFYLALAARFRVQRGADFDGRFAAAAGAALRFCDRPSNAA